MAYESTARGFISSLHFFLHMATSYTYFTAATTRSGTPTEERVSQRRVIEVLSFQNLMQGRNNYIRSQPFWLKG
eukprot:jgi/Botrbrau1/2507/Bobra.0226s0061.1